MVYESSMGWARLYWWYMALKCGGERTVLVAMWPKCGGGAVYVVYGSSTGGGGGRLYWWYMGQVRGG